MSLKFKPYDPSRQKQRAERRRHAKPCERTADYSISGSLDGERLSCSNSQRSTYDRHSSPIEEGDFVPTDALHGAGVLYAGYPSIEECLRMFSSVTDVSSACTPTSACSSGYRTDSFVWRGQDSAIDVEDDRPDCSSNTPNFNTSDATPEAVLNGVDLCRGWEPTDSISDDTYAQMASGSKLNNKFLAQNTEALGILASAASAEQQSASGISSPASVPGPGTQTFSTKRPLLDGDIPGESEGHDSEIYRSPKRSRRSDFNLHSSPRLESDDICPIPPSPRVSRGVDQSSQVPEDFGPQVQPGFHRDPSLIAPDHASSQSADPISLPTEQAESVRLELLGIQNMISSLLAKIGYSQAQIMLPDGSVQRTPETRDETEGPSGDDSDDDSHNTSNSDNDSDSACNASELTTEAPEGTRQRSTQRCRWTKREDDLLRRLKNVGMLSDFQIARKLNRSENGVKQHWHIMSRAN